jgi:hypothetical protein
MVSQRHSGRIPALVAVVLLLCLAGCASNSGKAAQLARGPVVVGAAELDQMNQTVDFPIDRFGLSPAELQKTWRAKDLIVEDCMRAAGQTIELPVVPLAAFTNYGYRYFGVWSLDQAASYGEGLPATIRQEIAWQAQFSHRSARWNSKLANCQKRAQYRSVDPGTTSSTGIVARGQQESTAAATADPMWKAALTQYQQCMTVQGYTFDNTSSPFVPVRYNEADEEQQIRIALENVSCKLKNDLPQMLCDVIAAYQLPFIARNEAELVANRKRLVAKIDAAELVIARHS